MLLSLIMKEDEQEKQIGKCKANETLDDNLLITR